MIPAFIGQVSSAVTETGGAFMREAGKFCYQVTFATAQRLYQGWDDMTGCQLVEMVFKSTISASVIALAVKKQPFSAKLSEYPKFAFLFTAVAVFSYLTHDYFNDESTDVFTPPNFREAANKQNELLCKYPFLKKILSEINN